MPAKLYQVAHLLGIMCIIIVIIVIIIIIFIIITIIIIIIIIIISSSIIIDYTIRSHISSADCRAPAACKLAILYSI